ncbi:MAG: CRISPR-associated endonuclease Cas1 [Methanosphaera sp.]|nr:CRISPR-associated endonuclease Cas1 [Methanosphaera sp.]
MKIIIEGYNKSIHKKSELLQIKEKEDEIYKITPRKVTDITLLAKGYVTFDALTLISKHNIPLISINKYGQIEYILTNPHFDDIMLRKQQYKTSENYNGVKISKEIIKSKIKNQYSTIKTLNKTKKYSNVQEKQKQIKENIKKMDKLEIRENKNINYMKNIIRGIEGETSKIYWACIKELTPKEINFQNRNQKPRNDLLNAMLNYGYSILASEITRIILQEKLDPYCGLLHSDLKGRTSLTYDLIEEFRQQITDKSVLSLINNRQIKIDDIDKRSNRLKIEARKVLAQKILDKINSQITYNDNLMTYQEIMQEQSRKLKDSIMNERDYRGFYLQW